MPTNERAEIDELYSKMLETADTIGREGFTKESVDALKSIEDGVNELTLKESSPEMPENPTSTVSIDATSGEFSGEKVMTSYNPTTGEQAVVDGSESIAEKIAERHLDNLINGTASISDDILQEMLTEMGSNSKDSTNIIASLIARRMSGDDFDVYEAMPPEYKRQIDMIYSDTVDKASRRGIKASNIYSKKSVATMMIDGMIEDFKKSFNTQIDLDTILAGFDKDVKKMSDEFSTELGGMMMSFDDERKAEIDAAIKRCEENGKTEGVEKLKAMKDTIDDAYNLTKFIEFCKTCKIRNIEVKEPEKRVFSNFNVKYEKHRYTINDIRSCPTILDRHLTENNHIQNTLICIAFCKYCQNMNPDNMNEHTFMYYFIRNIIAIDRLNPKGRLYEGMDDRSKQFYDNFVARLKEALAAIISRNPNFSNEALEDSLLAEKLESRSSNKKHGKKKKSGVKVTHTNSPEKKEPKMRGATHPYIYTSED